MGAKQQMGKQQRETGIKLKIDFERHAVTNSTQLVFELKGATEAGRHHSLICSAAPNSLDKEGRPLSGL